MTCFSKKNISALFYYLGIFRAIKYFLKNHPIILVYHRFSQQTEPKKMSKQIFEKQMRILKKNFKVISAGELIDIMNKDNKIPDNSIVITVDDGHEDFFLYAYPVLKKYSLPATLFVTTDFVDKKEWLWPDKLNYIIQNANPINVNLEINGKLTEFKFRTSLEKERSWDILSDHCLSLDHLDCLKFIDELASRVKIEIPEQHTKTFKSLNWDQVIEMAHNRIEIGSHTCSHPRLTKILNSQLVKELAKSKKLLEEKLNKPIDGFCYPFGRKVDINTKIKLEVQKTGYLYGTIGYFNSSILFDKYELKRLGAGNDMNDFIKKIYGYELLKTFLLNKLNDR